MAIKYSEKQVDRMMHLAGSQKGFYNHMVIYLMALQFCGISIFYYALQYYISRPKLLCTSSSDPTKEYTCDWEDACDHAGISYRIDYDDFATVDNWITRLGMECAPDYQLGLFGSMMGVGLLIGSIVLTPLADLYGRKITSQIAVLVNIICLILATIIDSKIAAYVLIVIIGMFTAMQYSSIFLWSQEVQVEENRAYNTTVVMMADAFASIIIGIFYWNCRKVNYNTWFVIILSAGLLALMQVYLTESPYFLANKRKNEELKKTINFISLRNGKVVDDDLSKSQDLRNTQSEFADRNSNLLANASVLTQTEKDFSKSLVETKQMEATDGGNFNIDDSVETQDASFKDFCRDPVLRKTIISLTVQWGFSCYSFFFLSFYVVFLPISNEYLATIILGVADCIVCGVFEIFLKALGIKKLLRYFFLLSSIFAVIFSACIYFEDDIKKNMSDTTFSIIIVVSMFLLRFTASEAFNGCYYANDFFVPTLLKAQSLGICNVAARLGTAIAPLMSDIMGQPALTIPFCCIIAFFSTFMLTELSQTKQDEEDTEGKLEGVEGNL